MCIQSVPSPDAVSHEGLVTCSISGAGYPRTFTVTFTYFQDFPQVTLSFAV